MPTCVHHVQYTCIRMVTLLSVDLHKDCMLSYNKEYVLHEESMQVSREERKENEMKRSHKLAYECGSSSVTKTR